MFEEPKYNQKEVVDGPFLKAQFYTFQNNI